MYFVFEKCAKLYIEVYEICQNFIWLEIFKQVKGKYIFSKFRKVNQETGGIIRIFMQMCIVNVQNFFL